MMFLHWIALTRGGKKEVRFFLSVKNIQMQLAEREKSDYIRWITRATRAERSISRHCPIIFQLRHWILINPWGGTASINLTPHRATNHGSNRRTFRFSRRLLQRLVEMLKLKGKKNDERIVQLVAILLKQYRRSVFLWQK